MNKNNKRYIVIFAATLSFIIMACSCTSKRADNKVNDDNSIKVVTTLYASYDFVREVAGDNVCLTMLLKPGEESHSYEPTPQDIIAIQECDLFIYNGGENDTWVDQVLESAPDVRSLKMMDCVSELREEVVVEGMYDREHEGHHEHGEVDGHDENDEHNDTDARGNTDVHDDTDVHGEADEHEDEHDHEEYDEHIWTSPLNAVSIAEAIANELVVLDEDNADIYRKNCDGYVSELKDLDSQFRQIVQNAKRNVVIFGDRFPLMYFVGEYGLDYYAAFPGCSAETEPSVGTMTFLIDKMRENKLPVVFKTELSNDNIARTISEETGAKIRTFYACHNVSAEDFERGFSYLDMMRENVKVLKEALN